MTNKHFGMTPVRFDDVLLESAKIKTDPAFRQLTAGLSKEITGMLRDPNKLAINCCFEGCCVSWCCIQLL